MEDPDIEKSSVISKFPSKSNLYHKPSPSSSAGVGGSGTKLSAPDVTLTISKPTITPVTSALKKIVPLNDSSKNMEKIVKSDEEDRITSDASEGDEYKEQIYESLTTFNTELHTANESRSLNPGTDGGGGTKINPDKETDKENNLYAKVKKLSNSSNTSNCPNLNSEFMSIYELTKVETVQVEDDNLHSGSNGESSNGHIFQASPAVVQEEVVDQKIPPNSKTLMRGKNNPNFSFALDFSPKREINKVSFASFQPDNDENIIENVCDNNDNDDNISDYNNEAPEDEEEDSFNYSSDRNLINSSEKPYRSHSNRHNNSNNNNSQIENEPIPKMQLNMFIQKDGKQSGGKKWPKVETPFCRQSKIAEVICQLQKIE